MATSVDKNTKTSSAGHIATPVYGRGRVERRTFLKPLNKQHGLFQKVPEFRRVVWGLHLDLTHRRSSKRCWALKGLGEIGYSTPSIISDIASTLADPSPSVRDCSAWALAKMGRAVIGAANALEYTVAFSRSPWARINSLRALSNLGPDIAKATPTMVDTIVRRVSDKDWRVRFEALHTLVETGVRIPKYALPIIVRTLRNRKPRLRVLTLKLLSREGLVPKDRIQKIARNRWTSKAVMKLINEWIKKGAGAVPFLGDTVFEDHRLEVNLVALRLLGKIGAPAVRVLREAMFDEYKKVRIGAVKELAKLGRKAAEAIPWLRRVVKDKKNSFHNSKFVIGAIDAICPDNRARISRLYRLFRKHFLGGKSICFAGACWVMGESVHHQGEYMKKMLSRYRCFAPSELDSLSRLLSSTPMGLRLPLMQYIFSGYRYLFSDSNLEKMRKEFYDFRNKSKNYSVVDRDTQIIMFSHAESIDTFDNDLMTHYLYKVGAREENIFGLNYSGGSYESQILSVVAGSEGKTLIVAAVHSNSEELYLDWRTHIDTQEMGDALLKREARGRPLKDIFIAIAAGCHSDDYMLNLYSYLIKKGAKSLPRSYASSNENVTSAFNGLTMSITAMLYNKKVSKVDKFTLGDFMQYHDSWVYQDAYMGAFRGVVMTDGTFYEPVSWKDSSGKTVMGVLQTN